MNYRLCAMDILDAVGGESNFTKVDHCVTRLRFSIVDYDKIKKADYGDIDGVRGIFEAAGQFQVVIGMNTVDKVYKEFAQLTHIKEEKEKKSWFKRLFSRKNSLWGSVSF